MGQGATIFGCAGPVLTDAEAAFFKSSDPWGFILFTRNLETPDQIRALCADLRQSVGRDAPILIDQEGGRVERMAAPHWTSWMPPLDQVAQNPAAAERSMYLRYRVIATELLNAGIDTNCVPCLDVARPDTHEILQNRCYGADAELVGRVGRAVANAHLETGVLPVMKHMPGLGTATLDSHLDLPRVATDEATLHSVDFAPFKALSDLPLGMSAHIVYENLGEVHPATTSSRMVRRIRDEIGFDGLLMTDDLSMEALSGSVATRARNALNAGIDVILHCNGDLAEMKSIAGVAGEMSEQAQRRADRAIDRRNSPDPVDIQAAKEELEALLSGGN